MKNSAERKVQDVGGTEKTRQTLKPQAFAFAGLEQILEKPMLELNSSGKVVSRNALFERSCLEQSLEVEQIYLALTELFSVAKPTGAFGIEVKFEIGLFKARKNARLQFVESFRDSECLWIGLVDITSEKDRSDVSDLTQSQIYSARLSAVAEMSSGIAHEINNPLTVVLAKSNLIDKIVANLDHPDAATISAAVKKISTHAQRISKIIKGLKNFSRDETGDPMKIFNVVDSIEECVSLSAERFKAKGILLYVDVKEKEMLLNGRDYQISQILINLLNNAFDAVDQVGFPEVHVQAFRREQKIVIRCWDTGPGVSHELEQKIMLPFFTTKPTGAGTGLGLSVSLGIANVHGGSLALNREVASSCFELSLPERAA